MNNTRDPSPSSQSHESYSSLRRRPAQRGPPPGFYVMQSDSTGTYIEHWHAPQGSMQCVSAIRNGVRTGDVAYEFENPQGGQDACPRYEEFRAPFAAQPARCSGQSKRYHQGQPPFQSTQPKFQIPHVPKPFEGEEEAIQQSLEDYNREVAIQKSREDELIAQQEAEAVRRSLEDQRTVQQEIEEHEVLLRALARQETLLTGFSEQRTDARAFNGQEDLVAQLRQRLLALER